MPHRVLQSRHDVACLIGCCSRDMMWHASSGAAVATCIGVLGVQHMMGQHHQSDPVLPRVRQSRRSRRATTPSPDSGVQAKHTMVFVLRASTGQKSLGRAGMAGYGGLWRVGDEPAMSDFVVSSPLGLFTLCYLFTFEKKNKNNDKSGGVAG